MVAPPITFFCNAADLRSGQAGGLGWGGDGDLGAGGAAFGGAGRYEPGVAALAAGWKQRGQRFGGGAGGGAAGDGAADGPQGDGVGDPVGAGAAAGGGCVGAGGVGELTGAEQGPDFLGDAGGVF